MEILNVNLDTLSSLYEQYPESFNGLTIDGNYLVYNGEKVDISKFNINDLIGGNNSFAASLSVLTAQDIFKIIRLHSLNLESVLNKTAGKGMSEEEAKVEVIKAENPLMKNISIITKKEDGFNRQYINIVDSNGKDHLYVNDRDVDLFAIYEALQFRNSGRDITPDELIEVMDRKLYDVELRKAGDIIDDSKTNEDFRNKMTRLNEPYKDEKTIDVVGNEEKDIAVVIDDTDHTKHEVVSFDENEFGDLLINKHNQNVVGTDTIRAQGDNEEKTDTETGTTDDSEVDRIIEEKEEEVVALLVPTQEFYDMLNSPFDLTEEERKSVDLYYAYFDDLILYEEYLLPELVTILNDFRHYVYGLQYSEVEIEVNYKQQEAIDKLNEMEMRHSANPQELAPEKINENVKKLELLKPKDTHNSDNAGSISVLQVLGIIIGVSIILTAITLYLIG